MHGFFIGMTWVVVVFAYLLINHKLNALLAEQKKNRENDDA